MKIFRKGRPVRALHWVAAFGLLTVSVLESRDLVPIQPGTSEQVTRTDFENERLLEEQRQAEIEQLERELEEALLAADEELIAAKAAELAAAEAAQEQAEAEREAFIAANQEDFNTAVTVTPLTDAPKESSVNEVKVEETAPIVETATKVIIRRR
jgi:multidrug efflux pump subunit AcrA (membrane-fusion protein)